MYPNNIKLSIICYIINITVFSVHGGSFSQKGFGRYQINLPECGLINDPEG